MAYKYLVDLGHRRIGLIAETEGADPAVRERLDGFQEERAGMYQTPPPQATEFPALGDLGDQGRRTPSRSSEVEMTILPFRIR
jgi:hypothetical protein